MRKQFLERIEAKERGESVQDQDYSPTPPPSAKTPPKEEEKGEGGQPPALKDPLHRETPRKTTETTKLATRMLVIFVIIGFVSFSFAFLYRTFFLPSLEALEPVIKTKEFTIPRPSVSLIPLLRHKDSIRRVAIADNEEYFLEVKRMIEEIHKKKEGIFTRIVVKRQDGPEDGLRVSELSDFLDVFNINPPQGFKDRTEESLTLLVYTGERNSNLGFAVEFRGEEEEMRWEVMRRWEEDERIPLVKQLSDFFALLEIDTPEKKDSFKAVTYRPGHHSYEIRYQEFPEEQERLVSYDGRTPVYYSTPDGINHIQDIYRREEYVVLEETEKWYRIRLNNGKEGWVEKEGANISLGTPRGLYYSLATSREKNYLLFSTSLESIKEMLNRL